MKKIFKLHFPRTGLLILPFLISTTATAADSQTVVCALVERARIARDDLSKEGAFGRANFGHQIAVGTQSVLAVRIYENADGPPDAQVFKKATLEFKLPANIPVGTHAIVKVRRSYYSEGASAWVTKGAYSWASDPFHEVQLRRDRVGLHAELNFAIEAINGLTSAGNQPRKRILVAHQCLMQQQTVAELTAWQGRAGTTSQSFIGPI